MVNYALGYERLGFTEFLPDCCRGQIILHWLDMFYSYSP